MQTCIWPSGCYCHSLPLASVKSRLVFPFGYRLTWVVPDKGPLNGCVCVCDSVCLSVLCLFVIVINIIYVQATSFDGVFLLAAFHCTALICNYCLSLLLINIYRSIYLHEEGTERDMTLLRKNSSVFSLIRMRRLPSARAVKLCTNKLLQFLAGRAG